MPRHAADVAHNVADGIRSAAHTVHQAASHAADVVGETYDDVTQYACDSINRTRARARSLEESLETSVRQNPKTALLLAATVGLMIGAWCRRR